MSRAVVVTPPAPGPAGGAAAGGPGAGKGRLGAAVSFRVVVSFEASIKQGAGGGAYVEVPAKAVEALGGKARIPVTATFDGITYRGSIARMGGAHPTLGVLKEIRRQMGKSVGDLVTVTVKTDASERTVTVPDDLAGALRTGGVLTAFEALSYSHRREFVKWIEDAKRPETRERRLVQTVARLRG